MTAGEQGQWVREQPCQDSTGRDKVLKLFLESTRLGIQVPPGEVALLPLSGARLTRQLLGDAVLELTHRLSEPLLYSRVDQQSHLVADYNGRDQALVITAASGRVEVRVGQMQWFTCPADTADALADSLRLRAAVAREQGKQGR